MNAVRWLLGGAAAFLVVFYGLRVRSAPEGVATSTAAHIPEASLAGGTRHGALFRAAPKQGEVLTYRFTWSHSAENHLFGAANTPDLLGGGALGLGGALRFAALVPRDGLGVLALSIDDLRPLAKDAKSTQMSAVLAKQLAGRTAYLVVHPDGALQSIRFPDDAPPGFQNFVQRIVGVMLHARADAATGHDMVVTETTPFGTASTKYELRPDGQIYRARVAYTQVVGLPPGTDLANFGQELDSGALFAFRSDGVLSQLTDTETLRLTKGDDGSAALETTHGFALHLQEGRSSEGEVPPARLATFAAHAPWEQTIDDAEERRAVEDRIEGLTAAGLVAHVRAVAVLGPTAPDQLKFFNRATGLLKLHPEIGAQLVETLHEPKMTYEGRAFTLDILASAGNDVVQEALVRGLRDPRTRALPEYVSLYQRVSLVRSPSDATVAFAQDTFERLHADPPKDQASEDLRTASVFALGSVAGHMMQTRRLDGAERLCRRLVEKMDESSQSNERKRSPKIAYITALGNAGVPAQEALLLRLSDDDARETRTAALNALRKYDTPASRARVVAVLTSPVGRVHNVDQETQAEALRAFELMSPDRTDIQAIAAAIVHDTLHRDLYGDTIRLFRKGKAPLADVSAALDLMFERSAQLDNDLQTRIDTLRAELAGLAGHAAL